MTTITIPELSLVVLIGASGSGKSTFATKHFARTEVLSSDFCRGLVSDDENDQSATEKAFEVLYFIAGKRLEAGKLVVVDATNVQPQARKGLVALAKAHHVFPIAIVLEVDESVCLERNRARQDREFGPHVIRNQLSQLRRSLPNLRREGFNRVFTLRGVEEIDTAVVERQPLWTDRRSDHGPFDIIGDVHGCYDELVELLELLGYSLDSTGLHAHHPAGRRAFFVGDLVDRGPRTPDVLRLVMNMVESGDAVSVPGNHEVKLLRALKGTKVNPGHGLAESLSQLAREPAEFSERVATFIDGLVSHFVLDGGNLVVAHAGLRADMQGRSSGAVRSFALYGDTTGETDEYGLPVRYPWAEDYRGDATVVYGHTPVPEAIWLNRTICIDTGCVFGGKLTALRYPERELVSVPAHETYWEPARPFLAGGSPASEAERLPLELDLEDVMGKRIVETRLNHAVTIHEENAAAALEVMSRFAVDPRWLVYLPPTMAPTATSDQTNLLEHPLEAFSSYRRDGVQRVVCEEKHMGSRAVVLVCRSAEVAERRFGVSGSDSAGVVVTRTGRPFFADRGWEQALLDRVRNSLTRAGTWEELQTDWLVLDCELLPWSLKAGELLREQYAHVGTAAVASLGRELALLEQGSRRGLDLEELAGHTGERLGLASAFVDSYRRYCWPVSSIDDVRLAPFQVLVGDGKVHALSDHLWHLELLGRLCVTDPGLYRPTASVTVDLASDEAISAAVSWWSELTANGGEGMVVKPVEVAVRGPKGLVQPGIKCRGPEYLRLIYGPEYTSETHLSRLRSRGLGHKRSLALREFALGIEGMERFVAGEPLYRVHECVFGVLALESEPVDPRL
jgi:protein phosphatase